MRRSGQTLSRSHGLARAHSYIHVFCYSVVPVRTRGGPPRQHLGGASVYVDQHRQINRKKEQKTEQYDYLKKTWEKTG